MRRELRFLDFIDCICVGYILLLKFSRVKNKPISNVQANHFKLFF